MNAIVAVYSDWGIGYNRTQPVVLREDRLRFRELTTGGTVIAGRKTLEDFPGGMPLPKRKNIILTKNAELCIPGALTACSIDELFALIGGDSPDKVFVIGGGSIYSLLLPYCNFAYITKVGACPESDTFFPDLDALPDWSPERVLESGVSDSIPYSFNLYKNKAPLRG